MNRGPIAACALEMAAVPEVYNVDTGLLAELRAVMRQAAVELGQWVRAARAG